MKRVNKKERNLIADGKMIHAIKSYKDRSGLGLKEAKTMCDAAKVKLMFYGKMN